MHGRLPATDRRYALGAGFRMVRTPTDQREWIPSIRPIPSIDSTGRSGVRTFESSWGNLKTQHACTSVAFAMCSRAGPVAWTARDQATYGCSFGCAWSAVTSAVATRPRTSMRRGISGPHSIRSLDRSSQAKHGPGAISTSFGSRGWSSLERRLRRACVTSMTNMPRVDSNSAECMSWEDSGARSRGSGERPIGPTGVLQIAVEAVP